VKGGLRLLVVDDQARTSELFRRLAPDLALAGPTEAKTFASSWAEAEAALGRGSRLPDAVVLDLRFEIPDEELLPDRRPLGDTAAGKRERRDRRDRQGLYILERLRRRAPDLPIVLTTAHEDIPFEDDARRLRADAFTYTMGEDDATGEGLVRVVRRVLADRDAPLSTGRFFWGRSPAMRELRRRIEAGEWVVDLRDRTAFAAGHVPGTFSFALEDGIATYLGWLIPWGAPLTLLGHSAQQVSAAQRELGFD